MKPTEHEIDLATSIITSLFQRNFKFALTYHCALNDHYGLETWLRAHQEEFDCDWYSGETKVCIAPYVLENWIIKVDFDRNSCPKDYYEDYQLISFCEQELITYEKAVSNNLQSFFAPIYKIGTINEVTFYLQEKVSPDEEAVRDNFENYSKYFVEKKTYDDDIGYFNAVGEYASGLDDEDRLRAMFDDYDNIEDLIEFIHENEINDLHEGNYGMKNNGNWVIFDYSGYC